MTMGVFGEATASLAYLFPAVVAVLWLWGRGAVLREFALWVPAALAADLIGTLVLSRAVCLSMALLIMRVLWVTALGLMFYKNGLPARGVSRQSWIQIGLVAAVGLMSFWLSASISRPSSIWDRQFHIPLVTMLGGQRLPFKTVFQPNTILHFHFAGDVVAVAIQTFSFGRIHASLAIALAHDLMFLVTGMCLATLLLQKTTSRLWIFPAVLALFFSGPFAVQRSNLGPLIAGFSYLNLLCMSYRPSIVVTILFLVGALAAVLNQSGEQRVSKGRFNAILLVNIAVLAISDEPTAVFCGMALGALWIVAPRTFFGSRVRGLVVLGGVLAAILVPNLLFQAALVPGGPVQNVRFVPFRAPGFSEASLPLRTPRGLYALFMDVGPFVLVAVAALGAAVKRGRRETWALVVALWSVLIVSTLALTTLDFNGMAIENHRFMTFPEIVFPVVAVALLAGMAAGRWERILLIAALSLSAVSTFHWYQYGVGPGDAYFTNEVDCRHSAGARLFERVRPTYVPFDSLFAFAGCRPIFYPGSPNGNNWSGILFNGYPRGGRDAFEALSRDFVTERDSLQVACRIASASPDTACTYARARRLCKAAGAKFETCELSAEDRRRVLATPW